MGQASFCFGQATETIRNTCVGQFCRLAPCFTSPFNPDTCTPMHDRFLTYFKRHFSAQLPQCLAAVSGGIDSVVLVHLLKEAGVPFGIAHVNFRLRAQASEGDQAFVEALAHQLGVPFHTTVLMAKEAAQQPGVSVQMAARQLRYQWFENCRQQQGYELILTAHHATDQTETMLYNLAKGSGLGGLHGILPLRGKLFRPLLLFTKAEVEQYAKEQGLTWRQDASNASDYYQRNKIRHHVLPVLQQINPQVETAFARTAQRVQAAETVLNFALSAWQKQVFTATDNGFFLSETALAQLPEPAWLLAQWLKPYGFTEQQAHTLWQERTQETGKRYPSATHLLYRERTGWQLQRSNPPEFYQPHTLTFSGETGTAHWQGFRCEWQKFLPGQVIFEKAPSVAYFDAACLVFPLVLRPWQEGDAFCPLGMKGKKKKVSDLLTDLKIRASQKRHVLVLESNGAICWVVGYRADERFKITPATQYGWRVAILPA